MLGMVFGLRLHQSEEFLNSVLAMMGLDLPVPDHTTLRSCARETAQLRQGVDTLVISGGETDVCVLTAALGAIDLGYGVIILKDAVCSGDARDAALTLFERRFPYRPTL